MFDVKMTVSKLNINKHSLIISVSINCPFDINVSSPKAKIVFQYGEETRRLPLLLQNYFRHKQGKTCVIVCSYVYNLDYIFTDFKDFSSMSARIELYYGEQEVLFIPFSVSSNVIHDNRYLHVEEECIEYESVEGVTVFDNDENTGKNAQQENLYSFELEPENGKIIISKGKTPEKSRQSVLATPYFHFVFKGIRAVMSLVFSPALVVIGFFAGINSIFAGRNIKKSKISLIVNKTVSVFSIFMGENIKETKAGLAVINFVKKIKNSRKNRMLKNYRKKYEQLCKKEIVPNRVTFMSGRRDEIGGNYEFVYNLIKDREDIDFQFLMFSDPAGHNKAKNINRFLELYATSKVVIVDDYFRLLNMVEKRRGGDRYSAVACLRRL